MRVLFASMPFDGHFLPMTGVAQRLAELGHDVRFYTGSSFADRLATLGVPHEPFRRALEINGENMAENFPDIAKLKGPKRIAFDVEKIFFANIPAHYADILELHREWAFDLLVNDAAFFAAYPVTRKLGVPGYAIDPAPTPTAKSAGAPPPFFGLTPARNLFDRLKHRIVWAMVERTQSKAKPILDDLLDAEGLPAYAGSTFQLPWDTATRMFQTGLPSMDFDGIDWPAHHQFVGPLLPPRTGGPAELPFADRLAGAPSVVVVSQGTVDNRDPEKLFVPTLEALKDTGHLVVATTGGRHTEALRQRFPHDNVIVEDWVDYAALLPHADVFVSNGGYGSIMQAIMAGVPIVSAGWFEAKNDINARLAYRKLAVDLRTERPTPAQITKAIGTVTGDPTYRTNIAKVAAELRAATPVDTVVDAILADRL
ncbi:glycosyltransferase [Gordonia sp. (in: high G+C Gram-positive bacteria)]|uniref:glycosyltransferase n=2 Tax=Gordonia sp. (in: high G+C Gram-positive bacteria) TaxID=84139 RepID=UPI002BE9AE45|nr:glycosyltransferase [Gordonia sp. (in: high G+C Gram-positive bacteria)]HMS76577.1 glycosyltransferase [Gordonia sp. (in: high G+C Gram-positive bacteria)]